MQQTGLWSLSARLHSRLTTAIQGNAGWLPFDRYMAIALYEPGLGYYARSSGQFGALPAAPQRPGSDFITAPEISQIFGELSE